MNLIMKVNCYSSQTYLVVQILSWLIFICSEFDPASSCMRLDRCSLMINMNFIYLFLFKKTFDGESQVRVTYQANTMCQKTSLSTASLLFWGLSLMTNLPAKSIHKNHFISELLVVARSTIEPTRYWDQHCKQLTFKWQTVFKAANMDFSQTKPEASELIKTVFFCSILLVKSSELKQCVTALLLWGVTKKAE